MPEIHFRPDTILIFRALKLGDMLCSLPAIRAVREKFPHAHVALVSHPVMEKMFQRYPHLIDEFLPFSGFPGMPETPFKAEETVRFLSSIQRKNFDLVIQMHGSGEISNLVTSLFNGKRSAGFLKEGNYCPDSGPGLFVPYPESANEIHRCLSLLEVFGISGGSDEIEFEVFSKDESELERVLRGHGISLTDKNYVCVHPGASVSSKRWSTSGFAKVADYVAQKGFRIVFTGSSIEAGLIERIRSEMQRPSQDTASLDLPLGPLAALIKKSRGLICNDTGVSHLAAGLKVPSIVLFTNTDPVRWAPLNKDLHRSLFCPSVDEVFKEIDLFLSNLMIEEVV